jgi:hypothetical protein
MELWGKSLGIQGLQARSPFVEMDENIVLKQALYNIVNSLYFS